MENKIKNKTIAFTTLLFVISSFALLNRHTDIDIFKWYLFILILISTWAIGFMLSNLSIIRIIIYIGFSYLSYQNYFIIENRELRITFISSLLVLMLIRIILYLTPIPYIDKRKSTLTLLQIKARHSELTFSNALTLFIINIFEGFFSASIYILSLIITLFIWLIFL